MVTDGTGLIHLKLGEEISIQYWQSLGTKVMFSVLNSSNNSISLWLSNGTVSGTVKVKDLGLQAVNSLQRFQNRLIFRVGYDTWISDGTEVGTTFLTAGITDGSATIGNEFYGVGYNAASGFARIYKTNRAQGY